MYLMSWCALYCFLTGPAHDINWSSCTLFLHGVKHRVIVLIKLRGETGGQKNRSSLGIPAQALSTSVQIGQPRPPTPTPPRPTSEISPSLRTVGCSPTKTLALRWRSRGPRAFGGAFRGGWSRRHVGATGGSPVRRRCRCRERAASAPVPQWNYGKGHLCCVEARDDGVYWLPRPGKLLDMMHRKIRRCTLSAQLSGSWNCR